MSNKSFTISLIILLTTIASVAAIASRGVPVVVATNLENLPMEIAGFKATEDFFPESVYKELNADKHVYRHYRADDGRRVDLYIGYYGTAKGGRTGHNPYACLPGAGWGIVEARKVQLTAHSSQLTTHSSQLTAYCSQLTAHSSQLTKHCPNAVEVNYVLARKGQTYESVLHWYQSAGTKVLATGIQQNIQRFLGRILKNRNDGAFVRVTVNTNEEHIEEANKLATFFAETVLGLLPDYWPVEK